VSFRSTGDVDVNALARQFGGGGHAKAERARCPGHARRRCASRVGGRGPRRTWRPGGGVPAARRRAPRRARRARPDTVPPLLHDMSTPLTARIEAALAAVRNPRINAGIVDAAQVHDVATTPDGRVRFTLLLDAADDATLVRDARRAVEALDGVTDVRVDVQDPQQYAAARQARRAAQHQAHAQHQHAPPAAPAGAPARRPRRAAARPARCR
jgi:metal-sulfur cluster biosynthetic enzyme